MEHSDQALRYRLLGIRHHLCIVPSIKTGDKLDNELCATDSYRIHGHCDGGLVC